MCLAWVLRMRFSKCKNDYQICPLSKLNKNNNSEAVYKIFCLETCIQKIASKSGKNCRGLHNIEKNDVARDAFVPSIEI